MFERLQKPFLTIETGEAYQPIRLSYQINHKENLVSALNHLHCLKKTSQGHIWNWFWQDECAEIAFESLDTFKKNNNHPTRLGTVTIKDNRLYINLPSFKRACHAVPFFHRTLDAHAQVDNADFINKVFGLDERLPHGYTELFKEDELDKIIAQRAKEYADVQKHCEEAKTAEEALTILSSYTRKESEKRLPYAERYHFPTESKEADVVFLSFYIFLRSRELIAIRRWFGESSYNLADAVDETVHQVFGNMDIDLLD